MALSFLLFGKPRKAKKAKGLDDVAEAERGSLARLLRGIWWSAGRLGAFLEASWGVSGAYLIHLGSKTLLASIFE